MGRWRATKRRGAAVAVSLAGHIAFAALAVISWRAASPAMAARPISVALSAPAAASPTPPRKPPRHAARLARAEDAGAAARHPVEASVTTRPARTVAAPAALAATARSIGISDADIAGALRAGDASGAGGGCHMVERLQAALRRDPTVRATAAEATAQLSGHALLIWNGDWVQSGDEDGKGLSTVREAVVWEVAFAPPACRAQAMRGLVLITLGDSPGAARLALGSDQWRWSDLLRR